MGNQTRRGFLAQIMAALAVIPVIGCAFDRQRVRVFEPPKPAGCSDCPPAPDDYHALRASDAAVEALFGPQRPKPIDYLYMGPGKPIVPVYAVDNSRGMVTVGLASLQESLSHFSASSTRS